MAPGSRCGCRNGGPDRGQARVDFRDQRGDGIAVARKKSTQGGIAELDGRLSNDEFVAKVKANTARWEAVANYNQVREDLKNEILLKMAPVVLSVLAALVGL